MLDFTSSLYLGMRHTADKLPRYGGLTEGKPAALSRPPGEGSVARALARLTGFESALLGPSTLHLFWDLLGLLLRRRGGARLCIERGIYPLTSELAQRAARSQGQLQVFRHHDADDLERRLAGSAAWPVVLVDGYCPGCGRPAPVRDYLALVESYQGLLVIDDTQALGVWGSEPTPWRPFGYGGGGVMRLAGIPESRRERVIVIASLAKAFGAPIAGLMGAKGIVSWFERQSWTRLHASPPSATSIAAAGRALEMNARVGEPLRSRLSANVAHLRERLSSIGGCVTPGLFPVQSLAGQRVPRLYRALASENAQALLQPGHCGGSPRLTLVVTAAHEWTSIERVASLLERAWRDVGPGA